MPLDPRAAPSVFSPPAPKRAGCESNLRPRLWPPPSTYPSPPLHVSLSGAGSNRVLPAQNILWLPVKLWGTNSQDWGSRLLTMWFQWFQLRQPAGPPPLPPSTVELLRMYSCVRCHGRPLLPPDLCSCYSFSLECSSHSSSPPIGEIFHNPDQMSRPCDASSRHPVEVIASFTQLPW